MSRPCLHLEEVNVCLLQLGINRKKREQLQAKKAAEIKKIEAKYEPLLSELTKNDIEMIEAYEGYVSKNLSQFEGEQEVELHFGKISVISEETVFVQNNKTCVHGIKGLVKPAQYADFLIVEEKPNKEALKALTAEELKKLGVTVKSETVTRVDLYMDRIN